MLQTLMYAHIWQNMHNINILHDIQTSYTPHNDVTYVHYT